MDGHLTARLQELATLQCGVVSRAQLRTAGMTDAMTSRRIKRGGWQRMHVGIYAMFSGPPGREALLWAAVLYAGHGAVLSHQTAAELGGLSDGPSAAIHVLVPRHRRVRRKPGIVVHLSSRAAQAAHPARTLPQTRIEETVLDLWQAASSLDQAVGWLTAALGRRLTTQGKLLAALAERDRMAWRRALTELLSPDAAGQHSILEHRYVRDVERPHGLLAHPAETRWRDIHRDNRAAVRGIAALRYGWLEVTTRPCVIAAEVAGVLSARGYRGARPCSAGCPVPRSAEPRRPPAQPAPPLPPPGLPVARSRPASGRSEAGPGHRQAARPGPPPGLAAAVSGADRASRRQVPVVVSRACQPTAEMSVNEAS